MKKTIAQPTRLRAHPAPEPCKPEQTIPLSPRDWAWLLESIKNPPQPNARLKAAMKRYQDTMRGQQA